MNESISKLLQFAKNKNAKDFEALSNDMLDEKINGRMDTMKQGVAQNLLVKENYEGHNPIDAMKRIVDMDGKGYPASEGQVFTCDNGDEVIVTTEMAEKLVDFFELDGRDASEQHEIQRKMRRSEMEFMNVLAAAGGNMA